MDPPDGCNGHTSMGEGVTRTLVDGVPVFWVPEQPRNVGALMFRVGRADESILQGGLTHLVEHLALFGLGAQQPYVFNAMVEPLRVTFHASGTPEELVAYFAHVCAALRSLPLERAPVEARVLRTEAINRRNGLLENVYGRRFGLRGLGVTGCREMSLEQPVPAAIAAWAAENFTAGNASAWFSCAIPPELHWDLPAGTRRPVQPQETIPNLSLPAVAEGPSGVVALSLLGTRNDWPYVPAKIGARRVEQSLRYGEGITYGVEVGYDVVGPDLAHTLIAVSTLDQNARAVMKGVLRVLRELADTGPTEEELHALASELERDFTGAPAVLGFLDKCAFDELLGCPSRTIAELADEVRGLTPATVAKDLGKALDSTLLLVPEGTGTDGVSFSRYDLPSAPLPSNGRSHRWSKAPFPWSKDRRDLVVGDEGIAIVHPSGRSGTLLYSEVAVALVGAGGFLELVDFDGFSIHVEPSVWRNGAGAVRRILSLIPSDRVVRIAE